MAKLIMNAGEVIHREHSAYSAECGETLGYGILKDIVKGIEHYYSVPDENMREAGEQWLADKIERELADNDSTALLVIKDNKFDLLRIEKSMFNLSPQTYIYSIADSTELERQAREILKDVEIEYVNYNFLERAL